MPTFKPQRIPINIGYLEAGYSAHIYIGSQKKKARVLLDTGSATLAVKDEICEPENDQHLKTTTLAQNIIYGQGAWAGPVINTSVSIGDSEVEIHLPAANIAIMESELARTFEFADGIWGLAYKELNKAYDIKEHLLSQGMSSSFPWPYDVQPTIEAYRKLRTDLKAFPKVEITPYFTDIEKHGLIANRFSLYTQRAFRYEHKFGAHSEEYSALPENHGLLILGGGEEQEDLFEGEFQTIEVVHDKHYNVNLKSVQVGANEPIIADPVAPKFKQCASNAIVDSGCTYLIFEQNMYQQVISQIRTQLPEQSKHIDEFYKLAYSQIDKSYDELQGIPMEHVKLDEWPTLTIIFEGDREVPNSPDAVVTIPPESYWQCNAPEPGQTFFAIVPQNPTWPNQSNFGLPFLNNYYTVFDRSADTNGELRVAKRKPWHPEMLIAPPHQ